ncbi:MAG: hypothetical protein C0600_09265, partial [Ignavibacteria bacterium]
MMLRHNGLSLDGKAFSPRAAVFSVLLAMVLMAFPQSAEQAFAQGNYSLSTVTANNGQSGVTFEITAHRSVRLHRFWNTFNTGSGQVEIWARAGGMTNSNSGWTFLGQTGYTATSNTAYTEIPFNLDFMMNPNETWGFAIFTTSGGLRYRSGTTPYTFTDTYMTIDTQFWGIYGSSTPATNTPNWNFAFYPRQFCGKVTYDEGVVGPNDAGILSVDSPQNFCAGQEDVVVTLNNFGTNQLTSATINWTLNGTPQTAYNWTGLLDTLNAASRKTQVTLASNMNFQSGIPYTIATWTTMPNGVADTINNNDSSVVTVQAAIAGTFTIGGASPDYATFSDAVADLNAYGVCGPVVFNVRSGTYNEQIALAAVAGASNINTITFQSESGNRADVNVTHSASGTADNFVLNFGSSEFVTVRNMTMTSTSTSYARVVDMGTSTDCTVESCELVAPTVGTTSNYAAVVYGYGTNNDRSTIKDCGIRNGSIGIYFGGSSNTNTQDYCVITGNEITNSYYTGYYSYYQGFETFTDNVINLGPGYNYMYLTFFYYGHDASIERNQWFGQGRTYAYGIYFYYQNYYVPGNTRFVNNMVTLTGQSRGYRAMYKYRSYNTLFAHNTMTMDSPYASGYLIYDYYPSGCEYYNNILAHTGSGYAWYMYQGNTATGSDYNVFYTGGNNFVYWNGNRADLTALQNASGWDQNSITKLPTFRDITTGDLHLAGPSEDDSDLFGTLLTTVTDDIDHEIRVQPYRGADEACYVLPGALTYEFVDGSGLQTAYAEAPGTVGVKYGVTFPPFASTVTFTVQFYDVINNTLAYQTTFQASKQANVDLFGTQYITLPPTLAAGAYRIEVIFNTKNSCDTYRDYMPYPSALLVVPEGRVPCVVWPGDVNNDGIVNYTDRRDLNYYIYNANLRASWLNGPARYRADAEINPFTYLEWEPQAAAPWFTPEGCYMD